MGLSPITPFNKILEGVWVMIDCEARISRDLNREYADERGDLKKLENCDIA